MATRQPDLQVLTGATRQSLVLLESEILAAGGEGTVYLPGSYPDHAAKIYHSPASDIQAKLRLMIDNPPRVPTDEEDRIAIAWPEDLLLDPAMPGSAVGFLMRRVSGEPVIQYYSPGRRRSIAPSFTYEHLLATARNIARAVEICHGQRYVIGDINESNVLVSETGSVALIDTDSFQVLDRASGQIHRSPVGKPEYTPAELQGHRFDSIDRTQDHDIFGLAVLIYQLLMEGVHPFTGVYALSGDPPQLEDRIANGHFPHSRTRAVPYNHSPLAPPWHTIHSSLQDLFIQCFDIGHNSPETRPTAHEWAQTLEEAQADLVSCPRSGQHRYFNHLMDCPWCERAAAMGGFDYSFPPLPSGVTATQPSFRPVRTPAPAASSPSPPPTSGARPPSTSAATPAPPSSPTPAPAPAPPPSPPRPTRRARLPGPTSTGSAGDTDWLYWVSAVAGYGALIPLILFSEFRPWWWLTLTLLSGLLLYFPGRKLFQRPITTMRRILIGVASLVTAYMSLGLIGAAMNTWPWWLWLATGLGIAFIFLVPARDWLLVSLRSPIARRRWIAIGAASLVGVFILGNLINAGLRDWQDWRHQSSLAAAANTASAGGVAPAAIFPPDTPTPAPAPAVPEAAPAPPLAPAPIVAMAVSTSTPTTTPMPTPTFTPNPTLTPTQTSVPTFTPVPTTTPRPLPTPIPIVNQDAYVLIQEGGGPEEISLDWNFASYGNGIPTATDDGSVNLSFSPVSHSADTAFITVEAKDDSHLGNGVAMIQITNELRNIVYLLVVEVQDAGEPTATPTYTSTSIPIPHIHESGDVLVAEGGLTNFIFSWNRGVYGDGRASITDGGPVNIWYSDIDHQDQQAAITVGANDDSLVGNGHAEITISNQTGSMVYVLNVEVVDAGEATATPTSTSVPTFTPTPTSTPTPLVTRTPTPIPLPNLSLEVFSICVEGMTCWPQTPNEESVSGSLRVSITWRVENIGNGPTQSHTDLRFYADGEYHEGEYLRYAFDIPILDPGESIGQRNQTLETPDSRWPLDFSLTGDNTIIAIVDTQDRVQEIGDDCRNLKVYRDRSAARNSTCDNVRYFGNLPFLPTPTPTPLFSPTPTPTLTPTPRPTPVSTPTPTPVPTQTPRPTPAGTSVGVTVTISWDMFDANEPNNVIYNVGLCDPSDCSREWLRDSSGTNVFLTWRSDDGQMPIPVPPGAYTAKVEAFTGNRTYRCTTDFEVTSSLQVVTTREDCNKAQHGQELKVR